MSLDARLAASARERHALVTITDLLASGWSRGQVSRRTRSGLLRRIHRGVYAIGGAPETHAQLALAAVLAAGDGGLASHGTAALLWRLPGQTRERIEITIPRDRLPELEGVRVHRSTLLRDDDRAVVEGIPSTSIARTLVDLTAVRGIGWIARAMDDSLRHDRVTLSEIRVCAERLGGAPGRRPSVVRMLVAERLEVGGGRTESGLERIVLGILQEAGIPAPEPQFVVEVDGRRYRLDFAWPASGVALEVDGFGPHAAYDAFHRDRRRDLALHREGWRVLRVTAETPAPEIVASVHSALGR